MPFYTLSKPLLSFSTTTNTSTHEKTDLNWTESWMCLQRKKIRTCILLNTNMRRTWKTQNSKQIMLLILLLCIFIGENAFFACRCVSVVFLSIHITKSRQQYLNSEYSELSRSTLDYDYDTTTTCAKAAERLHMAYKVHFILTAMPSIYRARDPLLCCVCYLFLFLSCTRFLLIETVRSSNCTIHTQCIAQYSQTKPTTFATNYMHRRHKMPFLLLFWLVVFVSTYLNVQCAICSVQCLLYLAAAAAAAAPIHTDRQ